MKRAARQSPDTRREPFISVIMPVRNEETCLGRLLDQLLAQDYEAERFEILVVDGCSTDGTRQIVSEFVARYHQVRLLENPRVWSSAARNVGVQAARGELLVIVDGHCELPGNQYLRTLAAAFERSGADCLGRPQPQESPDPSRLERAIGLARASIIGHHPSSYIYSSREQFVPAHSVAVAYRREVFARVGLFDETFDACEDVELNHRVDRAGLRCLLVPELAVSYRPRSSLVGLYRQLHRYGRGRIRLLRKHRDTFSLPVFAPALALGLATFGWAGALWVPYGMTVYLAAVASYLLLVLATSLAIACRERQVLSTGTLCAAFAAIHLGVAVGVVQELLSPGPGARRTAAGVAAAAKPHSNQAHVAPASAAYKPIENSLPAGSNS